MTTEWFNIFNAQGEQIGEGLGYSPANAVKTYGRDAASAKLMHPRSIWDESDD